MKTVDKKTAEELALVLINHGDFYRRNEFLRRNYARKLLNGKFDRMLAMKGLSSMIAIELRNTGLCNYLLPISVGTREYTADLILDHWEEEIQEKATEIQAKKFLTCY